MKRTHCGAVMTLEKRKADFQKFSTTFRERIFRLGRPKHTAKDTRFRSATDPVALSFHSVHIPFTRNDLEFLRAFKLHRVKQLLQRVWRRVFDAANACEVRPQTWSFHRKVRHDSEVVVLNKALIEYDVARLDRLRIKNVGRTLLAKKSFSDFICRGDDCVRERAAFRAQIHRRPVPITFLKITLKTFTSTLLYRYFAGPTNTGSAKEEGKYPSVEMINAAVKITKLCFFKIMTDSSCFTGLLYIHDMTHRVKFNFSEVRRVRR